MSEHNVQSASHNKTAIIVSGSESKLHLNLWYKVGVLTAIVAILILGVAAGTYYLLHIHKTMPTKDNVVLAQKPKGLTPIQYSQQLISKGDYSAGQSLLNDQLRTAATPQAKIDIYSQLAVNALNAKKYNEAKDYAQKADTLFPTAGTAYQLAYIAAKMGDRTTARKYYQVAINRLDKNSDSYDMQLKNYTASLRQVSQ